MNRITCSQRFFGSGGVYETAKLPKPNRYRTGIPSSPSRHNSLYGRQSRIPRSYRTATAPVSRAAHRVTIRCTDGSHEYTGRIVYGTALSVVLTVKIEYWVPVV
jgi:hypothetical protein